MTNDFLYSCSMVKTDQIGDVVSHAFTMNGGNDLLLLDVYVYIYMYVCMYACIFSVHVRMYDVLIALSYANS